ncbi:MAG TPA: glutathione S-transferase [Candidatus Acidoferrum sp.]|nr:glutathione S-transferase [Candidatus Acidoferrum sp.]
MLTLCYASGSCSLASYLALEHSGAVYQTRKVDLAKGEQRSPDYLNINPKGRVPALITDRGILTETPAILAYIAQSFPAARLAPIDDPWQFAQVQSFNSYLCSTVHVNHAHRYRGARWSDDPAAHESMRRKVPETMKACFDQIEREMFKGPFVLGEQYSICDMYLFTITNWLEGDEVDVNWFPKVAAMRRWMLANPAVQKVLQAQ